MSFPREWQSPHPPQWHWQREHWVGTSRLPHRWNYTWLSGGPAQWFCRDSPCQFQTSFLFFESALKPKEEKAFRNIKEQNGLMKGATGSDLDGELAKCSYFLIALRVSFFRWWVPRIDRLNREWSHSNPPSPHLHFGTPSSGNSMWGGTPSSPGTSQRISLLFPRVHLPTLCQNSAK